ncbi:YSC84-related protein [Buttiauxella sp. WJP83]|uniref:lipid-binding SYLF domain-containing protein n=1 Tax=Buttiauxella sp. WJP83 TaxID=2986951 RepID=UPI0022DDC892|nr:YSC84-related protein [Buttiauxella sp. WJP83]WBM72698.1 YSC84-related protein [Buttiauxella sp. WJP83]
MQFKKILLIAILAIAGCSAKGDTASQQRNSIQQMRIDTLSKLYKAHPEARKQILKSKGYAVFSANSSKILTFGFGSGYGVVKNHKTGKDTYMKMAQAGAGVGLGVKQLRTILIFNDSKALNDFIKNGYIVGADANAAAKYDNQGLPAVNASAGAVAPSSVELPKPFYSYELTEKGLAAQAMINGYKYWPDDTLNGK